MATSTDVRRLVRFNIGVIDVGTTIYFASGRSITYRQHGSAVVGKQLDINKVAAEYLDKGGNKKEFSVFYEYLRTQGYIVSVDRNQMRFDLGNDQLMDEAWGKMAN